MLPSGSLHHDTYLVILSLSSPQMERISLSLRSNISDQSAKNFHGFIAILLRCAGISNVVFAVVLPCSSGTFEASLCTLRAREDIKGPTSLWPL